MENEKNEEKTTQSADNQRVKKLDVLKRIKYKKVVEVVNGIKTSHLVATNKEKIKKELYWLVRERKKNQSFSQKKVSISRKYRTRTKTKELRTLELNDLVLRLENPYLEDLEFRAVEVIEVDRFVDKDTVVVDKEYSYDLDRKVSLFQNKLNRMLFGSMTYSEMKLFLYICMVLKHNDTYVFINHRLVKEDLLDDKGFGNYSLRGGIKKLISRNIIRETGVKDFYWINPKVFFAGNRVEVFKDNYVKGFQRVKKRVTNY